MSCHVTSCHIMSRHITSCLLSNRCCLCRRWTRPSGGRLPRCQPVHALEPPVSPRGPRLHRGSLLQPGQEAAEDPQDLQQARPASDQRELQSEELRGDDWPDQGPASHSPAEAGTQRSGSEAADGQTGAEQEVLRHLHTQTQGLRLWLRQPQTTSGPEAPSVCLLVLLSVSLEINTNSSF